MKLRQRIHRRATYNRPEARFRTFYKVLTEGMVRMAEQMHHTLNFVGPPKPTRLHWTELHVTLPFTAGDAEAMMSRRDVQAVVKNMPPMAGIIDVTKG